MSETPYTDFPDEGFRSIARILIETDTAWRSIAPNDWPVEDQAALAMLESASLLELRQRLRIFPDGNEIGPYVAATAILRGDYGEALIAKIRQRLPACDPDKIKAALDAEREIRLTLAGLKMKEAILVYLNTQDVREPLRQWLTDPCSMHVEPTVAISFDGPADEQKPRWDEAERNLYFDGEVVKHFNRVGKPSGLVLTCFEEQQWANPLDDPKTGGKDPKRVDNTVTSLNKDLSRIQFFTSRGGTAYEWRVRGDKKPNQA